MTKWKYAMIEPEELKHAERIQTVLKAHGRDVSVEGAHHIWERLSVEDYDAGFLFLPPTDEELWKILDRWLSRAKPEGWLYGSYNP
jgi:hypothetical protein